jgi:ubiquinone/menaquinone biosynthesis C-methylase UbiE/peroxiredoxin
MRGVEQIPWLYEIICSLYEWSGLAEWRRWLVAGARGRVLDLGTGTGRNLPLLPRGTSAIAVDPSLDALQRARRRAPAVPLVAARAEALPFRERSFDTVLTGLVFCSVEEPLRGFAEVKRVLRPDGRLRMLEHVRSTVPWRARLQDLIQPAWTRVAGGCHPNRDTEATVEHAGFRIDPEGRRAKGTNRRFAARVAVFFTASILAVGVSVSSAGDPFAELDLVRPGRPTAATDFSVPRLDSGSVTLKDLRGQVVFLNFWATWCPPCKEEMPSMERLYRRHKEHGFTILAISIDTGGTDRVASFVKKLGLTFPIGLDPNLDVANRYTVRALPSSFLIDSAGYVAAVALGPRDWDGLAAHTVVDTLLRCRTTVTRSGERDGQRC